MNIDVSDFFNSIKKVSIYKCLDTGYRFYYPFNISGDNIFYQKLKNFLGTIWIGNGNIELQKVFVKKMIKSWKSGVLVDNL